MVYLEVKVHKVHQVQTYIRIDNLSCLKFNRLSNHLERERRGGRGRGGKEGGMDGKKEVL